MKSVSLFCAQLGGAAANPRRVIQAETLLLALVLAVFVWFAVKVYGGPYLPSSKANDGFGYFMGAKSFYLNHNLRAPALHLDNVSPIGEFSAHGFGYSFINGAAALLAGWHDNLIITVNILLLVFAVLFILTRGYERRWALAFVLVFLTYFLAPTMTFAFMQENIHLLLALVIGHLLLNIVSRDDASRPVGLIVGFYVLVAAAAIIRPSWVFWAAGLLAIARSRRDLVLFGTLLIAYVTLGQLILKLFYAPYPYYSPHTQTIKALMQFHFIDAARLYLEYLLDNFSKLIAGNLYVFGLSHIPNGYTFLITGLTGYLFYRYYRHGDRPALAVALVAAPYIVSFLFLYDSLSAARHMGIIFVLQLIYVVMSRTTPIMVGLACVQLALLPFVIGMTDRITRFQASAGAYAAEHREYLQKITEMASAIAIGRRATIYLDNTLTNGEFPLNFHLPLRSGDQHPVRYSLDMTNTQPMAERRFDSHFMDFVLSAERLDRSGMVLNYQADRLYLYRLKEGP